MDSLTHFFLRSNSGRCQTVFHWSLHLPCHWRKNGRSHRNECQVPLNFITAWCGRLLGLRGLEHSLAQRFSTSTFGLKIPVQIGPEGLGAPFCNYNMASPRCPSYKLAEPNVHRGRFLLQNGSPRLTPSYKMVPQFCSTRIRSHPFARFALYRMVGTGGGYTRTILGSLGSNLQQPGQPESLFIFPVLLRSSVCFGVMLFEWPN